MHKFFLFPIIRVNFISGCFKKPEIIRFFTHDVIHIFKKLNKHGLYDILAQHAVIHHLNDVMIDAIFILVINKRKIQNFVGIIAQSISVLFNYKDAAIALMFPVN